MAEDRDNPHSLLHPATLAELFRRLESTDVDELEVVQGDARLYVRREPGSRSPAAAAPAPVVEGASDTVPVVAPLTGAYYGRPSPEQSPFVVVGQPVEAGQVVALIESMKLFNEVSAEIGGEVAEIAALDGDVVEVGQPLLYIRPHMEGDAT